MLSFALCSRAVIFASAFMLPLAHAHADSNSQRSDASTRLSMKELVTKWMLSDEKFVAKAAVGSRAEIEMSKLAIERSSSPQIRDFAAQTVRDHTAATIELKQIAQSKNLPIPTALDLDHQERLNELQNLNGDEFDVTYVDTVQKDDDRTVTLFAAAAADKKLDQRLQQFASKKLPLIRGHQDQVHTLENKAISSR